MPMNSNNLTLTNPLVVSTFRHSVYVSAVVWIIAIALVILVCATLLGRTTRFNLSSAGLEEPRARTYLRLAFGAIWIFDGILQFQVSMPLGLANSVVRPMAEGTPAWLHTLMLDGVGIWNNHPIALAVGTAWLQVGIGLLMLVSNATVGRVAAGVSVGWAALIWLIGNGAGGIFQSTSSILFGWPGATLFYAAAGVWLAISPSTFQKRYSLVTLRALGVLFAIAAILQMLPSRGFWHGGNTNALTAMTTSMTAVPQPHVIAWFANQVGDLSGTMGGGFNVAIILWLGACAVGLWMAPKRQWRWPIRAVVIGAAFFWFSAQDAAIFGGVATDVNSLVPIAVMAWCASPRLVDAPPLVRRMPKEMRSGTGAVLAAFSAAMIVFSVVSMGFASAASAENTLYVAQNGPASSVNTVAPGFTLIDQSGVKYSLNEHAGHYTLLTFLDPVCWTDCPLLAAQLASVRSSLSASAKLDIVSVAADPYHETLANVNHFIAIHDLGHVKGFYFVTDSDVATVRKVWNSYGIGVSMKPTDKMSIHSDYMFIIDPHGRLRWIIPDDPLSSVSGQSSAESQILSLLHGLGVR